MKILSIIETALLLASVLVKETKSKKDDEIHAYVKAGFENFKKARELVLRKKSLESWRTTKRW